MNIYQNMANQEKQEQFSDRSLWSAVLLQAIEDWKSGNMRLKRAAEDFFFQGGSDFAQVCRGAGLSPDSVLGKLRIMKASMPVQPAFALRQAA